MEKVKMDFNRFTGRVADEPVENMAEDYVESEDTEESEGEPVKKPRRKFFGKLAFFVLLASIFLLPTIFIPSQSVSFIFTKQILFFGAVLLAFFVWAISRLKDGRYELPMSPIVVSLGAVAVVTLLSSLFSGKIGLTFFGNGFEVGTAVSILLGFFAVFIIPLYFTSKDRIFSAYLMVFAAFAVLALFEIIRLFLGPTVFSFGLFTDAASTMIGKWNDFGVFLGLTTVLALVTVEFFPVGKLIKILSFLTLFVSLALLALINLSLIWLTLGLFSVVLFVYLFSFANQKKGGQRPDGEAGEASQPKRRNFPTSTLIVLLISVLFIVAGGYIGNKLSSVFNISQIEVWPSWQATIGVAKGTLKSQPLLGAGPNQFGAEWLKYKDPSINSTLFWNTNFSYGVGLIPTYLVNNGLLGIAAWLVFFGFFLYAGFRAIFLPTEDRVLRYLTISSFLGAFFLWIFNVFYSPGNVIVALTFIMTGLFVSALAKEGLIKIKSGFYTVNARLSFVSVLSLIFLLAVTIGLGYGAAERFISYYYYQNGLVILNNAGNVDRAEASFLKADSISNNDGIYQALTEVGIIRMGNLLSSATKDTPAAALQSQFQTILGTTLNYANKAISLNGSNYQNWVERGRVYESIVPLKINGAYEAAASAYQEALKYDPEDPSIYLMLARLEYTEGNNSQAKDFITQALNLKPNYTDAIFLLAQIQIKDGNVADAIKSVQAASVLSPNDPTILFQLGLLQYSNSDYSNAALSLERAVALSPQYANAKYYLGLSYDKLGRPNDAIAQFTDLKQTNPDNQEVSQILANLKAGKPALANTPPPASAPIDKRTKPPVTEKNSLKNRSTDSTP